MKPSSVNSLVLGTVNSSYRRSIDADLLASSVAGGAPGPWLSHLATFFTEVRPHLILAFARLHGIGMGDLERCYSAVKTLTGEFNRELEAEFAEADGRR
jgi:hypothetical protein